MTNNNEGTQGNPSKKVTCELSKQWQSADQKQKAQVRKAASVVDQPPVVNIQADETNIGLLQQRQMKNSTLGKLAMLGHREQEQQARKKLFPGKV